MTRDATRTSEKFLWAEVDEAARTDAMMTRSTRENFPVALRMLPAGRRRHLMAVYGFARITDDIGDEAPPAERPRMLDELEADVRRLSGGQPRLPVIRALEPTVARREGRRTEHRREGERQHDRTDSKKNTLQPHRNRQWVIPPDASAGFVAAMEDVLETYQKPRDPDHPLVCLDETSKQLVIETRKPIHPSMPHMPPA